MRRLSNLVGILLLAITLGAIAWLLAQSPTRYSQLVQIALKSPPATPCVWTKPWKQPARFQLLDWSQPEQGLLWSNGLRPTISFRLPSAAMRGPLDIRIRYAGISSNQLDVSVNDFPWIPVPRGRKVMNYQVTSSNSGVLLLRFRVAQSVLHIDDPRYLGIRLDAINICPATQSIRAPA